MYSQSHPDQHAGQDPSNRISHTSQYSEDSRRESYMDPGGNSTAAVRREDDHQKNLHSLPTVPTTDNFGSFGGFGNFGAYAPRNELTDGGAMGLSEPGSPMMVQPEDTDRHSTESHSSGDRTKVESRSPSAHRMNGPASKDTNSVDGYGNREVSIFRRLRTITHPMSYLFLVAFCFAKLVFTHHHLYLSFSRCCLFPVGWI